MKAYTVNGIIEMAAWQATPVHKYIEEPPGPCQFDIMESFVGLENYLREKDCEQVFQSKKGLEKGYFLGSVAYSSFFKGGLHIAHYFVEYPLAKHAFAIGSLPGQAPIEGLSLEDSSFFWRIQSRYKSVMSPAEFTFPNRHSRKKVSEAILRHLEDALRA